MNEIYLLSGLGADKRVFDFIDLSGFNTKHVNWIDPLGNEALEGYVTRLLAQITSDKPTLIGVSFGGMVAIEIGKRIETNQIILISSAKTMIDIPIYFRLIGTLGLHNLMPTRLLKTVNCLTYWFFGAKTASDKKLLKTIIEETDPKFLKWAINVIVTWKNRAQLKNVTHIHGANDRILPLKTADLVVQKGGHLMIVSKGKELGDMIPDILMADKQLQ